MRSVYALDASFTGRTYHLMVNEGAADHLTDRIRRLIRSADDDVLRDVARHDNHGGGGVTYAEACELHYAGLRDVIFENDCRAYWPKHFWYPMEAVELRAFGPDRGEPMSFALAVLILLLDDREQGEQDHMEFRTSDRYVQAYRKLPKEHSGVILTGLDRLGYADRL